ncbi:unnamed protein product [Debaryomyces tyrocola]|nr:unnamed protein product [Debaryomyces tyrocola]
MGSGVGGVVFNLGMQKVIEARDYHWELRAQAIIASGVTTLAVILIRTRSKNHKIQFVIVDKDCLKCTGFWFLSLFLVT